MLENGIPSLSTKVTKAEKTDAGVVLSLEPAKGGAAETLEADAVLVSIGRRPNTDGLSLDKAGLTANARGQIETDHAEIVAGVRHSRTIGSPIGIIIRNKDWQNWTEALPVADYEASAEKFTVVLAAIVLGRFMRSRTPLITIE